MKQLTVNQIVLLLNLDRGGGAIPIDVDIPQKDYNALQSRELIVLFPHAVQITPVGESLIQQIRAITAMNI